MAAALNLLQSYDDSGSSSGSEPEETLGDRRGTSHGGGKEAGESITDDHCLHLKPRPAESSSLTVALNAAPIVDRQPLELVKPLELDVKEVKRNPKYEELFAPKIGPENPYKSNQQKATKNMLSGFVEPAHVSEFTFERERKTFHSYGYALDPGASLIDTSGQESYVGNRDAAVENKGLTVWDPGTATTGTTNPKRKREKGNFDPSDVDNFQGPWRKFADEETVSAPSTEEKVVIDEFLAKRKKRGKKEEEKPIEERSVLHIKDAVDYQGRSFLCPPKDTGVNLLSEDPPDKCFLPKKHVHTWTGHSKGVSTIKWFPKSAHLLLSCSMDTKIKIWEVYNQRRCIRTYSGHKQAVRDICFSNNGEKFLSASYDRYVKLWDTESGKCISKFSTKKIPYCVKFHPDEDKQHLFVAGCSDKKIVCFDINSGEVIQEYDRHLGAVNTITFIDENRRFVSTSDDKSLRIWEWDIPVDFKYIADPSMHAIPFVKMSPNEKFLACQSMDNKVYIYTATESYRQYRKKEFRGHMVAGYACGVDFSPDMSYVISGDADGKVFIWSWKNRRIVTKFHAHDGVCIGVLWHPHETSKVATCGWDGLIKYWD